MFAGEQYSKVWVFFLREQTKGANCICFNEQWREWAIYPQNIKSYEWSAAVNAE